MFSTHLFLIKNDDLLRVGCRSNIKFIIKSESGRVTLVTLKATFSSPEITVFIIINNNNNDIV